MKLYVSSFAVICTLLLTIPLISSIKSQSSTITKSIKAAIKINASNKYELRQLINFSVKSPFYLVQGAIPFWEFGGDAVVTDDYLRITPAEKYRAGWIAAQTEFPYDQFVIEVTFKVGGGGNLGADGMAFWYTKDPPKNGGVTFGGPETWQGLGILLDTFDNDRSGNHPYVGIIYNDGTLRYDPSNDGVPNIKGGCKFTYRNYETKMRLTYADGIAQIEFIVPSLGHSEWTLCASAPMVLPSGYYFGLTAATERLFDNHDVMNFVTYRLVGKNAPIEEPPVQPPQAFQPPQVQQPVQPPQQQPPQQQRPPPQEQPPAPAAEVIPKAGIQNRPETIANKLKTLVHEFEDKENEAETPRSEPTRPREPATNTKVMGVDTQTAVFDLLKEIQSMREQQSEVTNSVLTLQNAVNSYVTTSKRVTDDLVQIKTTQQSLSDAIDRLMDRAATKDDVKSNNPSASATAVTDLTRQLNELKTFVQEKVTQNSDWLGKQVQQITNSLNDVKVKLDSAKGQQQALESQLRANNQEVTKTIEESGSWGFWIYFFLFQVLFGVSFMWWKRLRDNEKKLL